MKVTITLILAVGAIVLGTSLLGGSTEVEVMNEPVVELTAEQKFEEARKAVLMEIETLESERDEIEAEIERKKGLLDWSEEVPEKEQVEVKKIATKKRYLGASVTDTATEQFVREYFADTPILITVAYCESTFRQYRNGKPLKNPGSSATGIMQLMASYHRAPALNMGLDIDTVEGNLGFAKHLYETEGLVPWEASRHCWGNLAML